MTTHDMNAKVKYDAKDGRVIVSIDVDMSTTLEYAVENFDGPEEWMMSFKEGWDKILEETAATFGRLGDPSTLSRMSTYKLEELLDRLQEELRGDECLCPDCCNARVEQAGWEDYLDDEKHPETDVEIPEWLKGFYDDA